MTYEYIVYILIAINVLVSMVGLNDAHFVDRHLFSVGSIRLGQIGRMLTSGFLHADLMHLAFNMISLYYFAPACVQIYGLIPFIVIYFVSLIAGNLLALWMHFNDLQYRALGASGAVSGIIFAVVIAIPDLELMFFFIPIPIKGYVFAIGYVIFSIIGIYGKKSRIGHDAHLGGAISGALVSLAFIPELLFMHPWVVVGILAPTVLFLLFHAFSIRLHIKPVKYLVKNKRNGKVNEHAHETREQELNRLLDKMNKSGADSLTAYEKWRMDELSGK